MNAPQLPAFLQNRQSKALATELSANLGAGSPPYISIMGNRFTLIDSAGDEEPVQTYSPQIGPYLDCVLIDAGKHISKIFYDKPFDPNATQYEAPVCWSDNGVGPSRNAAKPQSPTCAACPNAVWGSKVSAISGKGVKACSDFQKLAILIPGDEVTFLLRVPPNSLSTLRAYNQKFIGQSIDVSDVITRISFEQGQIGLLKFDAVNYIDEPVFKQREAVIAQHKTDALVGHTDLPREGALPAPQQAPALAAPVQQPSAQSTVLAAAPMAAGPGGAQHMVGAVPIASPTPEQPSGRRQRRRNTAAAPNGPAPAQTAPVAPFREAAPAATPSFGMQAPAAPGADVQAALDGILGKAPG